MIIIFRAIISFALVGSFSLFFMSFFLVAGILSTKIDRNVVERVDEVKNLKGYATMMLGGLISGGIALIAMRFLV